MLDRRLPKSLRTREPSLDAWKGFAPSAAQKLLEILADAFDWNELDVHRLRPDDTLWSLYHHYYPQTRWWQRLKPDELEMETVLRAMQREAGADVDLPPDVTLADLVRLLDS